MNLIKSRHVFHAAWPLAALLAILVAISTVRGAERPQPCRFLLIFQTSSTLKKNLPAIRQDVVKLLSSNFQHEIQADDDLAVWTVDQSLHTGTFPLASWAPEDAEMYSDRLGDFLGGQKYTRHTTLAAVQPLLNRVVKNSERLTVIIFCDSESRLLGSPYDSGVNEIITNAAANLKNGPIPFLLVLRSEHGEYLGCSVNRALPLNFPKFPPPPPPPVAKPVVVAPPPIVAHAPAMIIVGTNASSKVPPEIKPAAIVPPPELAPAATNAATNALAPAPVAPKVAVVPPPNPAPVQQPPVQAPPVQPPPATPPATVTVAPAVVEKVSPSPLSPPPAVVPPATNLAPAAAPVEPPAKPAEPVVANPKGDTGYGATLAIGGGALVVAAALVFWLTMRSRRPQSSLITSSMQDDPHRPPRK